MPRPHYLVLALFAAACGTDLTTSTSDSNPVVGGTQTFQRPEVGYTGNCTATLIRPNVAITAAHCWGYGSREAHANYGWLRFDIAPSHSRRFTIVRYKSFGTYLGARDVTLLMLDQVVPNDLVTPTTIATEEPARGSASAIWGYGCTNQSRQVGAGVKRMVETAYGATDNLCPGDSGGPATVGVDGPIWGINSSYGSSDGFGRPYQMIGEIHAQIEAWNIRYGPPGVNPADDTGPPVVEAITPNHNTAARENTTITVSARITDDLWLSRTELEWDYNGTTYGCPTNVAYVTCVVSGDVRTWSIQVSTGQRTFRVAAVDIAGNRTVSQDRTVHLTPDGGLPPELTDFDAPVVTILAPNADIEVPTQTTIDVVAQITDASPVQAGLVWDFNGETYPCPHESRYVDCSISGTTFTWVVSLGQARARPFRIRATDAAKNVTETNTRTFEVREIRDEVAPTIEILAPTATDQLRADTEIQVTARITDDVGVASATLDWTFFNQQVYPCPHQSQYVDCSIVGEEYRWLVRVGTGERRYTVVAADRAGNETRTAEQTFVLLE